MNPPSIEFTPMTASDAVQSPWELSQATQYLGFILP